jgi:hypothetical protein
MRITVHLPDGLEGSLRQAATDEGLSISAITARAVEAYLKKRKKTNAGYRLLDLIDPDSVAVEAWDELEKGRTDDRA